MAVNASKVKSLHDADASVVLRNIADGAETSTATEPPISLKELDEAYWHGGEIPHGVFEIALQITACDATTGDETYVLTLQVDDDAAHGDTPVTIASYTIPRGTTGVLYWYVDSKSIPTLDSDTSGTDKWLAVKATLGGTTPLLTYGAAITKFVAA